MAIPLIDSRPRVAQTQLLDKYVLPKVALTVITIASLVGAWLTMTTHGAGAWQQVLPRWLHLVTFGLLAGGYLWKAAYTPPPSQVDEQDGTGAFMTAQFRRFRGLARGALPLLIIVFLADAVRFAGWGLTTLVWADLLVVLLLAIVIGKDVYKPQEKQSLATQRRVAGLVVLLLLVSALIQAAFDVTLAQGGQLSALLVRWIHISAFGLWLGGAVWNIFIAVPAARETVSVPVVVAAGKQLERFRVAVRIFLPALLLSGLVQTYRYIGLNVSALWASSFGLLILAKIGLVVALVVIFITCPLWRACSPIAGMCKLDDLPRPKSDVKQA